MLTNLLSNERNCLYRLLICTAVAGTVILTGCGDKSDDTPAKTDRSDAAPLALTPSSQTSITDTKHGIDLSDSSSSAKRDLYPTQTNVPASTMSSIEPEDEVALRIQQMSGTLEDVAEIEAMLPNKTISADAKLEMISVLQNGERDAVIHSLGIALQDPDPDVAASAVEAIGMVGNASDIPMLQKRRGSTEDETLQSAIDDVISFLEE